MNDTLSEALATFPAARETYEQACLAVWRSLRREQPNVGKAVEALGLSEVEAALWVCTDHGYLGGRPAELAAAGQGAEVCQLIYRTLHDIVC